MADSPSQDLFLGRQPILDREQKLAAYELLFRSSHFDGPKIDDDFFLTATVINHAFTELGVEAVLERHPGFINLNTPLLMSHVIEQLPRTKVVLEILETVDVSSALVRRCRDLREMGFRLALDDFVGHEHEFTPLLKVVEIVKVDIQRVHPEALETVTRRLQPFGCKLLAEKVESWEQVRRCLDLGYELFQGNYFAHPSIITGRRLSRAQTALMRLLRLLLGDERDGIDAVLTEHPELAENLSRLARLVTAGDPVAAPRARQPRRWLPLLVYMVSGAPGTEVPSPLLILAATRGKLMELLTRALRPQDREAQERAFLTGTLSLVNALLAAPLPKILESLPVASDVRSALLARDGELGALLALVEALEVSDLATIERALDRVPSLDHRRVIGLQVEAMRWADFIGEPA
jgi:EAL and modified HD-GYP domain-containing signal transduction protein